MSAISNKALYLIAQKIAPKTYGRVPGTSCLYNIDRLSESRQPIHWLSANGRTTRHNPLSLKQL